MPATEAQLDSHIRVLTPENISFEYRVASPFERLLAYLIDSIIMTLVVVGIFFVATFLFGLAGYEDLGIGMGLIAWFGISWFYGGLFETFWNGQTPGKKSMGLRVLRADGSAINAGQAILRNFLRVVDAQPGYSHLVGLLATACNIKYQRLGDIACGTMVVAEDKSRAAKFAEIDDVLLTPVENLLPANAIVSRSLAKAISSYVERRRYFGPARRIEIARHIGELLVEQYNLPPDIDHDALLCVLYRRTFLSQQQIEGEAIEQRPATIPTLDVPSIDPPVASTS